MGKYEEPDQGRHWPNSDLCAWEAASTREGGEVMRAGGCLAI